MYHGVRWDAPDVVPRLVLETAEDQQQELAQHPRRRSDLRRRPLDRRGGRLDSECRHPHDPDDEREGQGNTGWPASAFLYKRLHRGSRGGSSGAGGGRGLREDGALHGLEALVDLRESDLHASQASVERGMVFAQLAAERLQVLAHFTADRRTIIAHRGGHRDGGGRRLVLDQRPHRRTPH